LELQRRRTRVVESMSRGDSPTVIARILGVCRTSLLRHESSDAHRRGVSPQKLGPGDQRRDRRCGPQADDTNARDANPDEGVWGWTKYHWLPNFAPEDLGSCGLGSIASCHH
jgi:hypothetical protein